MTFYWRLKDIPELSDVRREDRREWWREAVSCSCTATTAWAKALMVGAPVVLLTHLHVNALLRHGGGLGFGCLVGLIYEMKYQQPLARKWLQLNLARQKERQQRLRPV